MRTHPSLIVCPHCDAVYRRPALAAGQVARCGECDAVLHRAARLDINGWVALTAAAAILFVLANIFPVISVGLQPYRNDATLWQATAALVHGAWAPLALPAVAVAIVAPFAQITLLGWVLAYAWHGRRAPGFRSAMKALDWLRPWSMLDVALLGVAVAAIKLAGMAEVAIGPGLWAMAALIGVTAVTAKGDPRWLWEATE
ncbi:paraquat-inducible protein A [Dyella sp. 2RAB6]|uniref:paraquat-inducible protein A n=1 Tax=Dyella sp. 2RAB6 TaxID=3232992 RepID=UPI003F92A449